MTRSSHDTITNFVALRRDGSVPLQEQLVAFVRQSIDDGRLAAGSRLPSSRRLAARLGISRTTVVEAYDRLAAAGYIEARPRAGVFVASQAPAPPARRAVLGGDRRGLGQHLRRVDAVPTPSGHHLPLAPGVPAIDHFPSGVWSRLFAQILGSAGARIVAWGDPQGEWPLRTAIAEYLEATRGICCRPEQVIVASGSQPLVEVIVRAAASAGDDVWFEEPGDPASRAVLGSLGLRPVPVPVDDKGLDVRAGLRAAPDACLALVAPSHHYPLGIAMSLARRRALLEWAGRRGAWVIENEIDADFRFVPLTRPTLHALDAGERVIYLGSFNKTLAPGLRIGYAVLPRELLGRLTIMAPTVCVATQLLLARFWAEGHLAEHLKLLREVHSRRRALLAAALREEAPELLENVRLPEAGLRLPLWLADGSCDDDVVRACAAAGIKVGRPFSSCYAGRQRASGVTIGFASTPDHDIRPAAVKLAAIIRDAEEASRRRLA